MKWFTHQAVAAGAAFALYRPAAGIGAAWLGAVWMGAVLPDMIDHKLAGMSRDRQRAFNRIHRGATHWFGWWLALWIAGLLFTFPTSLLARFSPKLASLAPEMLSAVVAGLGFGGLMHVLLDLCTVSGVPLVPWSRQNKVSLKLCKTGGLGEYAFLAVALAAFWFLEGDAAMLAIADARHMLKW